VEWFIVIVVAVALAITVRQEVAGAYVIPSCSMAPTLHVGDRVIVNKLAYRFRPVHRGDIIVFRRPPGEPDTSIADLIKRVIGLPGETISSAPDGRVLINGKPLAEPWLRAGARNDPGPPIQKQKIPAGYYFVMGDDRGYSADSRVFGPISKSLIVGPTVARYWPPSRIGGVTVTAGAAPGCPLGPS